MKADPAKIAKRLRDQRKQQKSQRESMVEQLAIGDAIIDEYDELIDKLDTKNVPLVNEINKSIDDVVSAYDARIDAGCLSPLVWSLVESRTINSKAYQGSITKQTWKVVKDPSQRVQLNYYGCKYYRYPKNREYGSNVIDEIADASIDQLTSVLVLFDSNSDQYVGSDDYTAIIKVGDLITDDLEDPFVFQTGNLPKVVGLGTTSYARDRGTVTGFVTSAVNRLYSDTNIGFLTSFQIGDPIYAEGIFPNGTTITGFGTAVADLYQGGDFTSETDIDFVTTSNAAIATTENHSFQIGITSTYNALFLDAVTTIGAARSSFLIVRGPDNKDLQFETTKNPIDPVEIGIAEGNKIGKGHKIDLINNGDPKIVAKWHEVQNDPEPSVGAGFAEYWVGAQSWPTYQSVTRSGAGSTADPFQYGYSTAQYAPEGFTISVTIGSSTPSATRSQTATSPTNPSLSGCTGLTENITDAEATMNSTISTNTPKINHYLKGTKSLRNMRNEEETQAWGMLQGISWIDDKRKEQKENAEAIEDYDWSEIE